MKLYQNLGGSSGVRAFEFDTDKIIVQFSDLSVYEYTSSSAGSSNLAAMKRLASQGSGLNSFINTNVKFKYSRKIS